MGVYTRFKKSDEGFRQLVELVETTPSSRQKKMIEVGMQEDPVYTEKMLQYLLTFQDILDLSDLELAEVLAHCPPQLIAYAIYHLEEPLQQRFLARAMPQHALEIKENLNKTSQIGSVQIGAGQMKLITITRMLERKGMIKTKRIPHRID